MRDLAVGVLISGGGTTLQNLIHRKAMRELPAEFKLVISSHANANGIDIAKEAGLPVEVITRKNYQDAVAHSEAIFSLFRQHEVELAVMGGYLEHLLIPDDFADRVINIHPSLIPAFSGKGFYGRRVHQAALDYGVKISGCTVHFVDNEFDHGPIIAQRSCPVLPGDTFETLQGRVFELECQLYPDTIAAIARNHVQLNGRLVTIDEIL